jgi:hypothetical protein
VIALAVRLKAQNLVNLEIRTLAANDTTGSDRAQRSGIEPGKIGRAVGHQENTRK